MAIELIELNSILSKSAKRFDVDHWLRVLRPRLGLGLGILIIYFYIYLLNRRGTTSDSLWQLEKRLVQT